MIDLTHLNTLQVPAHADSLITINSPSDIAKINHDLPHFFLGLGANVLFTKDFPGTIIKMNLKEKKVVRETDDSVVIEIAAGENWHELVKWTVDNNWSGIENMALIPGTVGAAAVGNIAAYGQSFDQTFLSLQAVEISTHTTHTFVKSDCHLGYRDSIFKKEYQDKFLITSVTLQLSKTAHLVTNYYSRRESLKDELRKLNPSGNYSISDVFAAVVNIRTQKMPDWTKIGTAGSFFKNPFVTKDKLTKLQSQISELQFYPTTGMDYPTLDDPKLTAADYVKIPAGRLLDHLGWRGKKIGHVGTYDKHALVIINLGGATGSEIYDFSQSMRANVKKNFDIDLEYEVQVV